MKEDLKALLSKTLNIDDSKFAELVKIGEDGKVEEIKINEILELDKARVKELSTAKEDQLKERFNNGYAKRKEEGLTEFEKNLRDKFEIQSDKKGIDLVADIVSAKAKSKGGELTPEAIKVSATYLDMMKEMEKKTESAIADAVKPYEEKVSTFERQSVLNVVNQKANGIIDSLNPIFSEDKVKANNQRKVILDSLGSYNYKIEGDHVVLLNENGEQLTDDHKQPVKFEEKVRNVTENLYDLSTSKKRSGGGGDNEEEDGDEGGKKFKWNGVTPKDQKEYQTLIANADSLKEKKAIMASWQKEAYD